MMDTGMLIEANSARAEAAEAYIERIRVALGGYKDSDLASLAETLNARNAALSKQVTELTTCDCGNPLSRGMCCFCDNDE